MAAELELYETDQTADWLIEFQKQREQQEQSYMTDLEVSERVAKRAKSADTAELVAALRSATEALLNGHAQPAD